MPVRPTARGLSTVGRNSSWPYPPSMKTTGKPVTNPPHAQVLNDGNEHLDPEETKLAETMGLPSELRGLMLLDALDLDPRPTFIFDLKQTYDCGKASLSNLVFCNTALNTRLDLYDIIKTQQQNISATWCGGGCREQKSREPDSPAMLFGLRWDFYTFNGRWRVASATLPIEPNITTAAPALKKPNSLDNRDLSQSVSEQISGSKIARKLEYETESHQPSFIEITSCFRRDLVPALSSEFSKLLYGFDWSSTHLGPMCTWSQQLLEMFKLMMMDPRPAMIFWGPNNVMLYNETAIPLMRDRHPSAIGLTVDQIYKDVWEDLHKPLISQIMETAEAQTHVNTLLCYVKNGFLEEVYADFTSIPVIGLDGYVTGVYQSIVENTEHVLTQRRTCTLSALAVASVKSRNLKDIWEKIITCLEGNDKDIPQILLFSLDAKWRKDTTRSKCTLEGSIRWSPKSKTTFDNFYLNDQEHALSKLFEKSLTSDIALYLDQSSESHLVGGMTSELNSHIRYLIDDFEPGPFGDSCNRVIVFPIRANIIDEPPMGFVVLGLNSRQPYNDSYQNFVCHLQQALAMMVSSGLRSEQETLQVQSAAEQAKMDHENLSAQLLRQIKESRANELRFSRFVHLGPIGICIYASDGSMAFANEQWWSMTNFPRDNDTKGVSWWTPMIFEEDRPYAMEMFTRLLVERTPVHFEIRLMPLVDAAKRPPNWALVSAYPEISSEDALESIVACFTDITEQKIAAEVERTRTEDAVEAKRQQEAFVDITSHEIRNPLSAVLQSAQEISSIFERQLEAATDGTSSLSIPIEDLQDTLHAAQIIEQCTMHQKRIVDDILTLSKMDAGMLPVIASPAQPLIIVEKTLDLFVRELAQAATEMKLIIDESYSQLGLDWLEFDIGRLSQMLINLTTNAIKFTKEQQERNIELRVGASLGSTSLETWHLEYLPPSTHKIQTVGSDWPEHECVYLHFSLTDTGTGMTLDEQLTLFNRFSQGSATTYTQYGGSGLGLFICRALVEIHGGQIGFSSVAGVGSTFGFFIRTRRPSASELFKTMSPKVPPTKMACRDTILNILLVEDNLINQRVLSRQLSKLGHTVTVASHGLECLEILRQSHFCQDSGSRLSIILMDIEMPYMDGMTCAIAIRSMEEDGQVHGHVPIIAITGNARDEKVQHAINAGIDEVVLKPFTLPVLMPLIDKLIKKHGAYITTLDKENSTIS